MPTAHIARHTRNEVLMTRMKSPYVSGAMPSAEPSMTEMQQRAMPMLTIIPTCLIRAREPDATPRSAGGTEDIIVDVFGAVNSPKPTPTTARMAATYQSPVPTSRNRTMKTPAVTSAIPAVGRMRLSILSERLPAFAVSSTCIRGWMSISIPASVADREPMHCRYRARKKDIELDEA